MRQPWKPHPFSLCRPHPHRLLWITLTLICNTAITRGQSMEVRFLAWDDTISARNLAVRQGETVTPVDHLHALQRSRPVRVSLNTDAGQIPMLLDLDRLPGHESPSEPAGQIPRIPLSLPTAAQHALVLVLPDPSHPLGLKTLAFADDLDGFEWGSFRVINTTRRALILLTQDQKIEIPPDWAPTDFHLSEDRNLPVIIAIEDPEKEFTVIYSTIWMPNPQARRLVFIVPSEDPRLGVIALKIVTEYPRLPAESPDPNPNEDDE
jgi:hypothetical protein